MQVCKSYFQPQYVYFSSETSSLNLNSEMPGDTQNVFLQWGGVSAVSIHEQDVRDCAVANALPLHVVSHKSE